jgi:hypothetical protein
MKKMGGGGERRIHETNTGQEEGVQTNGLYTKWLNKKIKNTITKRM